LGFFSKKYLVDIWEVPIFAMQNTHPMNHIFKGIRSMFYSQNELEKRGWDLVPSEQRKWELFFKNVISAMVSVGICGVAVCVVFLVQTDRSFNIGIYDTISSLSYIFGTVFLLGIIGMITIKH